MYTATAKTVRGQNCPESVWTWANCFYGDPVYISNLGLPQINVSAPFWWPNTTWSHKKIKLFTTKLFWRPGWTPRWVGARTLWGIWLTFCRKWKEEPAGLSHQRGPWVPVSRTHTGPCVCLEHPTQRALLLPGPRSGAWKIPKKAFPRQGHGVGEWSAEEHPRQGSSFPGASGRHWPVDEVWAILGLKQWLFANLLIAKVPEVGKESCCKEEASWKVLVFTISNSVCGFGKRLFFFFVIV